MKEKNGPKQVEIDGDWAAFERAVDVVVKAPPMHRDAKKRAGVTLAEALITATVFPQSLLAYLGGVRPHSPTPQSNDRILRR